MAPKALLIAAPASGHGKTVVTQLIACHIQKSKKTLSVLKLGPDYIDPTHHQPYSSSPCFNIDTWAMPKAMVEHLIHAAHNDYILFESATGLFDGTLSGSASAAAFCSDYDIPILLVIDCRAMGATVAAVVYGLVYYQRGLNIAGVVLNQVGSVRHERILKDALSSLSIPVIATIYRDAAFEIPSRHLGLLLRSENGIKDKTLEQSSDNLDVFDLFKPLKISTEAEQSPPPLPPLGQHIAIARDDAFAFSYPHILHFWHKAGATLSFFSPLNDETPKDGADAIFLPGGYPELHLPALSQAENFRKSLQKFAEKQGHIYGECGGFMVLGNTIIDSKGKAHEMLGLLPHTTSFAKPKLTLGYRNLMLLQDCLLGKTGSTFRGHCFHYTAEIDAAKHIENLFSTSNALSEPTGSHGYQQGNVCGSYHHIIAAQSP